MLMTYFFGHPMWCKPFKNHNFLQEPFPKYYVHFDVTSESGGFSSAPTCCDGGQDGLQSHSAGPGCSAA